MFLGFRKPLYSCTERMYDSSTRPGTSLHDSVYQAFPHIITDARERRPGYEANFSPLHNITCSSTLCTPLSVACTPPPPPFSHPLHSLTPCTPSTSALPYSLHSLTLCTPCRVFPWRRDSLFHLGPH